MHQYERCRNIGSAAALVGEHRILFIFVNDAGEEPWSNDLRNPVEARIEHSLRWIEEQAKKHGIDLVIEHACAPLPPLLALETKMQIEKRDPCAGPHHSKWQNQLVANLFGSGSVATRWEDLFDAFELGVRDSDGSAVLFCVRRYHPSVAFPFFEGENEEFKCERGIIYDKGGTGVQSYLSSLIAHEILHLYGAVDLSPNKAPADLSCSLEEYSSDIMHTPNRHCIGDYRVGDITQNLIGW